MKVKTCEKCKKEILKQVRNEISLKKYDYFVEASESVARGILIAFVAVLDRRGLSKDYIRKMYNDMLLILDYPEVFGKTTTAEEYVEIFSKKYGINFDDVKLKIESKEEFMHRNHIRMENENA